MAIKIAITGPKGFIGSHLIPKLQEKYEVIPIYEDILSLQKIDADVVIHLAAKSRPDQRAESFYDINVMGTLNILKLCVEARCKLIYFSTPHGMQTSRYNPRVKAKKNLLDNYSASKALGEEMVEFFVRNYGLQAVTIRPCVVYDEQEKDHLGNDAVVWKGRSYPRSLIPDFIINLIRKNNFQYASYSLDRPIQKWYRLRFWLRTLLKNGILYLRNL